jgi:hypothetical protein
MFDPKKSKINEDKLQEFVSSPIDENLETVPGIGPVAIEKLTKNEVTNTFQLIGVFLICKSRSFTVQQHMDTFWTWLEEAGISSHRATIVHAIASKMDTLIPGIYNI